MPIKILVTLALVIAATRCWSQEKPDLNTYFKTYIRLNEGQIKDIRSGKPVTKTLHSRTPAEIFVFGAVYINTTPDAYINFSRDFGRLEKMSGYVAIRRFSIPPRIADLEGFTFDKGDIQSLRKCKPGDCEIQMPASSMQDMLGSIDWSSANSTEHVNQMLQQTALQRLGAYQRDGNAALGTYHDKENPTDVAGQLQYILTYSRALPEYLPIFYNYLLSYPRQKPANVDDTFYWAKEKFGLRPTLRIVHVITMQQSTDQGRAYAIAEKQLYASHYFQTALDLTFCIPYGSDPEHPGFYLIKVMGSEQAGLTGFKGTILRKVAVDRSASTLQKSLASIKNELELRH